jgi:pimeloyl-ACP methyl ester carboxylesterase
MIKGGGSETEPVLLVHGLIGTLRDLVPTFADYGVRAYAPDLLGYGALCETAPENIGLPQQVAHLSRWMDSAELERVSLVGHSVGGAIAMLFSSAHPSRVAAVTSVEGNFSLADAFWSAGVARMCAAEAETMMAGFRSDPAAWLARAGVAAEPSHLATAESLLCNQPASTIQATARSVVEVTGQPDYARIVQEVFEGPIPVHLLSGERSHSGWDVPEWAHRHATSETILPGGHLMMVEDPARFVTAIAERL